MPREGCVDEVKLGVSPALLRQNAPDFFSLFGFSRISVERLYPPPQRQWLLWDNPLRNASLSTVIHMPMNVWDPVAAQYSFAQMRIEVFST